MENNTAKVQDEFNAILNQLNRIRSAQVKSLNAPLNTQYQLFIREFKQLVSSLYSHNQFNIIDKIELIDLLFEINLSKSNLPDSFIHQYHLLKIVCLILALNDEAFFLKKINKIASFLNQTAQAIKEKIDLKNEVTYLEILMCSIDKLIKKTTLTDADFQSEKTALLSNLKTKLTHQVKITHSFDDAAAVKSKQAIQRILIKQAINEDIKAFLNQTWSQVLAAIARDEGEDSKNWHQALKVATLMVWSVNINRVLKDYPKFLKSLTVIFSSTAEGLKKINAYEQYYTEFSWILTLEHAHIIAQVNEQLYQAKIKISDDSKTRHINSTKASTSTDTAKSYIDFAKQLTKGDWLELHSNDLTIRIKLIWVASDHSEFIFVNQSGEKVKECNLLSLAADLENKVITKIGSTLSKTASHNSVLKTIG